LVKRVVQEISNFIIQVEAFWVVTPCSVYPEDGRNKVLRKACILSQPRRSRL